MTAADKPKAALGVLPDLAEGFLQAAERRWGSPGRRSIVCQPVGSRQPERSIRFRQNVGNRSRQRPRALDRLFPAVDQREERTALQQPKAVVGAAPDPHRLLGIAIENFRATTMRDIPDGGGAASWPGPSPHRGAEKDLSRASREQVFHVSQSGRRGIALDPRESCTRRRIHGAGATGWRRLAPRPANAAHASDKHVTIETGGHVAELADSRLAAVFQCP